MTTTDQSYSAIVSGNYFIGSILCCTSVVLILGLNVSDNSRAASTVMGIFILIAGAVILIDARRKRLGFTATEIIKGGLFTKRIPYDSIEKITCDSVYYRDSRHRGKAQDSLRYTIYSNSRQRIQLIAREFKNQQEWADRLLRIANEHGISAIEKST